MFKGRHFDRSVIMLRVRWYLLAGLRDLEELTRERSIHVDHSTVASMGFTLLSAIA